MGEGRERNRTASSIKHINEAHALSLSITEEE